MTVILSGILSLFRGIADLFNKVWDFILGIPDFLAHLLDFLVSFLKELPVLVVDKLLAALADGLNAVFSFLPMGFISTFMNFDAIFGSSSYIGFFLEPFRVSYGLAFVVSAYLLRFFIRRLPIIG